MDDLTVVDGLDEHLSPSAETNTVEVDRMSASYSMNSVGRMIACGSSFVVFW